MICALLVDMASIIYMLATPVNNEYKYLFNDFARVLKSVSIPYILISAVQAKMYGESLSRSVMDLLRSRSDTGIQ